MEQFRLCRICNTDISHLRKHATTCSNSCRSKLFRSNKLQSILVNFRVPLDVYTNLAIDAFTSKKGISGLLTGMVVQKYA